MPTALAFLVSNFHSLVTIRLTSDNYLLWETQVLNALRANGFIEYVKGTIAPPPLQIQDVSNNLITNRAFLTWTLIDNQLLSCLTATLSSSTLPLVLGLEHASDVWKSLENRFNSLSRSNLHELKRTLFNFTKSGTMEQYIDDIKICAQKLSAVGYEVDDDDMVFHAINFLPEEEFSSLKQTLRTHRDLRFHELVSILKAEEQQAQKSKPKIGTSSVFVATQKLQDLQISGPSTSSQGLVSHHNASTSTQVATPVLTAPINQSFQPQVPQPFQSQGLQNFQQTQSFQPFQISQPQQPFQPSQNFQAPMFQPPQNFPQASHFSQSSNRFQNSNRNRSKGQGLITFPRPTWPACQICGKDNHSARTCHFRNTQTSGFPSPGYAVPGMFSPPGFQLAGYHSSPLWRPGSGSPSFQGPFQMPVSYPQYSPVPMSHHLFVPPGNASGYGSGGGYIGTNSPPVTGSGVLGNTLSPASAFSACYASGTSLPEVSNSATAQSWYLDSGATNHVTTDSSNILCPQPYTAGGGVMVEMVILYLFPLLVMVFCPHLKLNFILLMCFILQP